MSPLVGDFVEFEQAGLIKKVYSRRNVLDRPRVANIDQVALIISLVDPRYNSFLLNKMLAIVEFHDIKPVIIFTKIDLATTSYSSSYLKDGYDVYEVNNLDAQSLQPLSKTFVGKLTVFTGQSGVGKSTTIENLTGIKRETQVVSRALKRGKHTTRVNEILDWKNGRIIDTPGFSSLRTNLTRVQVASAYKDFRVNRGLCKFNNCSHHKEQSCKIKQLVFEDQAISLTRYQDYLRILEEVENG